MDKIGEIPSTTENINRIAFDEGYKIYSYLKGKYPDQNIKDLDIILNSICAALIRHALLNTYPIDSENFANICKDIILKNLKNRKK